MSATNQPTNQPTNRLEYIDAMRGFTMLLVVYSHTICGGYGIDNYSLINSFNSLLFLIRMPLFFFVSGFVLYKSDRIWDIKNSIVFIIKKFKIQIISTLLFLTIYCYLFNKPLINILGEEIKGGYWFTITLFEFYIIYIILDKIFYNIRNKRSYDINLFIIGIITFFATFKPEYIYNITGVNPIIFSTLGFPMWRYLIFFLFGVIIKRHLDKFLNLINNSIKIGVIIIIFFISSLIYLKVDGFGSFVYNLPYLIFVGIIGIIIIFSFFYKYQDSFTKEKKAGRILQYIGRRTLDIYLLHYFFLPCNLKMIGEWFTENINPTLEFFVSITLAAMVITLCLVTSSILRISPLLANWLFGVKTPIKN